MKTKSSSSFCFFLYYISNYKSIIKCCRVSSPSHTILLLKNIVKSTLRRRFYINSQRTILFLSDHNCESRNMVLYDKRLLRWVFTQKFLDFLIFFSARRPRGTSFFLWCDRMLCVFVWSCWNTSPSTPQESWQFCLCLCPLFLHHYSF